MVWHDLHLQYGEPVPCCGIPKYFFQTHVTSFIQDLPPVFWAEDDMVLAAVYQVVCFMVLFGLFICFIHNSIVTQSYYSARKTRTFIRYLKGIGLSQPHGHKIRGAFPLPYL